MLEPFLMLTVLNCFFMFSSTVTTCALWWQYRRNRYSSNNGDKTSKWKVKKSKSCEETGKKCCTNDLIGVVDDSKSSLKKHEKSSVKESKKEKRKKGRSKEKEEKSLKFLEKLTSTEDTKQRGTSPSSKSTVVMEVSTVQKVVQIFDNDHPIFRTPKETVTYRFSPENEREIEFIVKNKSDNKSAEIEKN